MAFLGTFLAAAAALLLTGLLPLRLAAAPLACAIVALSAWWYVHSTSSHVQAVRQPAGYALAAGALLGASVQLTVLGTRIAYAAATVHHTVLSDGWALAGVAAAVVAAAFFGAVGGLIAGLQIPKAAHASQASLAIAGVAVAAALLLGGGIVLYVIALAKAMSDAPG